MIHHHQPVDRIFDVVEIGAMDENETLLFFQRAFESVQTTIDDGVMGILTHYSAGFPKIMHLVGDAAYWIDKDGVISLDEAYQAEGRD